jgi:hypothetical protein
MVIKMSIRQIQHVLYRQFSSGFVRINEVLNGLDTKIQFIDGFVAGLKQQVS